MDTAVPGDSNVLQKEAEKYEKYQDLAGEIKRIWKLKGHCYAIWQLYKKVEGVFASIEFQN